MALFLEMTLNDGKKSASFMSTHSGMTEGGNPALVHSIVSMAHSEGSVDHKDHGMLLQLDALYYF
jgi:hypothetical protein